MSPTGGPSQVRAVEPTRKRWKINTLKTDKKEKNREKCKRKKTKEKEERNETVKEKKVEKSS